METPIDPAFPVDDDISHLSTDCRLRQIGWLELPSRRVYRNWEEKSLAGVGSIIPLYIVVGDY